MLNKYIDHYEIIEELATGIMGVVYKAYDPVVDRTIVIKTLHPNILQGGDQKENYLKRFYREVQLAGSLKHNNIIPVYAASEFEGVPYIVMEYVDGPSLQDLISSHTAFSPEQISRIMIQCCDALDYAHDLGIVHRDIKPANILVLPDDITIKLGDFGIAKSHNLEGLTQPGEILGTPYYMSPEQLTAKPIDNRSDFFSLGVLVYKLITKQMPFKGNSIASIFSSILEEEPDFSLEPFLYAPYADWVFIIKKALKKNPEDRYPSGKAFSEAIKQIGISQTSGETNHFIAPIKYVSSPHKNELIYKNQSFSRSLLIRSRLFHLWPAPKQILWVAGITILVGLLFLGAHLLDSHSKTIFETKLEFIWVNQTGQTTVDPHLYQRFKIGDGISIQITPKENGYYYILYLDSEKNGQFLFPVENQRSSHFFYKRDVTYYLPSQYKAYKFGAPPGKEEIHVIGSPQPLDYMQAVLSGKATFSESMLHTLLKSVHRDLKNGKTSYYQSIHYDLGD